jgi:hypothetical protein
VGEAQVSQGLGRASPLNPPLSSELPAWDDGTLEKTLGHPRENQTGWAPLPGFGEAWAGRRIGDWPERGWRAAWQVDGAELLEWGRGWRPGWRAGGGSDQQAKQKWQTRSMPFAGGWRGRCRLIGFTDAAGARQGGEPGGRGRNEPDCARRSPALVLIGNGRRVWRAPAPIAEIDGVGRTQAARAR